MGTVFVVSIQKKVGTRDKLSRKGSRITVTHSVGSRDKIIQDIQALVSKLRAEHKLKDKEIVDAIVKERVRRLPVSIFGTELCPLESVVQFLKDEHKKTYHEIAEMLHRNDRTIWSTYRNAKRKKIKAVVSSKLTIPIKIFSNRSMSVLENLVLYLRNDLGYSYHKMAGILKRNYKTIWTAYNRAMRKNEKRD